MNVRRKSHHRSANCKHAKKRANQRAAKERRRIERANVEPDFAEIERSVSASFVPEAKPAGFRISIECLGDGEKASFTTREGPFGLTISATDCGRRVAAVLRHYKTEAQHAKT